MRSTIATAALLASTAAATSIGSAIVISKCSYDVYVYDVPAADGNGTEIDQTLSYNGQFEQQWTELTNGQGWSIKLSPDTSLSNIMQYEYTFHNDGTIWFDLSDVNGNPWNGNWEITATNAEDSCDPKDQAYQYSTDDAYGMQACTQDSTITVTLCSADESDDNSTSSASSSVATASSSQVSTYSTASESVSSSTPATSSSVSYSSYGEDADVVAATSSSSTPTLTTFATTTSVSSSSVVTTAPDGVTVTEIATDVVTAVVTATQYGRFRRDTPHHLHHVHGHA